jgi:eukaryotic-like serine/threonine-protein kinase
MAYCISPQCGSRQNPDQVAICQGCATPLLIQERYRLLRPLRDRTLHCNAEVFEVEDDQDPGQLKILKVLINDDPKLVQLFQQEQALLTNPKLHHVGIPQGEAAFSVGAAGKELRCLVMKRINGQDLAQWIKLNGTISEAQAHNWLQQMAEILTFVHGNRLFHRDIKPANIMRQPDGRLVLIDFGTARQMTATVVNGQPITQVISMGYTAPEQAQGRAIPQSDFYALGRTFMHLLTGKHPADLDLESDHWSQLTPYPLSKPLVNLINQLVQVEPRHRPRNAPAILWQLQRQEVMRHWRWLIAAMVWAGLGGWAIGKYSLVERTIALVVPPPTCDVQLADALSCGEEILTRKAISQEKREAIRAWRAGDYREAEDQLNKALKREKNDPETLIYLNNARILNLRVNAKAIAVVVPLNSPDGTFDRGLEILRGVAQAQDEAIKQGIYIQVLIGDDANDPDQAKEIAQAFGKKPNILAVVGHYASENTRPALPIYRDSRLVVISPASTSTELSAWGTQSQHIFFRTVSTTQKAAQALAGYLTEKAPKQKVAVFYSSSSEFSRSLRDQFNLSLPKERLIEFPEFDLARSNFDAIAVLQQVKQLGGTTIALFPDGHTHPNSFRNSFKLLAASTAKPPLLESDQEGSDGVGNGVEPRLILGDSVLYSHEVLRQIDPTVLNRLVVAVPWHYLDNPAFSKTARHYWGGNVNYSTATAYDAVKVILKALEQQPRDRVALQAILADRNFMATGATGDIHFIGGDRREPVTTLVKVIKCPKPSHMFVPVDTTDCPMD